MSKVAHWSVSSAVEAEHTQIERMLVRWRLAPRLSVACTLITALLTHYLFVDAPIWPVFVVALIGVLAFVRHAYGEYDNLLALASHRDRALLEGLDGESGWLVDLMVHHGDAPVGSDRGVLWIEDDRLYFSGHRTSFGLTADQASDFCRYDSRIPNLKNNLELRLRHETPAGPLGISFSPVTPSGDLVRNLSLPILGAVNRWIGSGTQTEGQLPPLTLGPDAEPTPRLFLCAAGSGLYWISVVATFAWGWNLSPAVSVAFAMAGLVVGSSWSAVWSPVLRVRAWRDRLKLAA